MDTKSFRYAPLDPSMYHLEDDEKAFFKAQTGIKNDAELRKHILQVQAEAYAVYPYPCIHRFVFTQLKISRFPAYKDVLKLGRERPGAILLDLGCCFGNDTRKVIADGFPLRNVIASDLRSEFWALGHKLFKSSPNSFDVTFLPGDIFDPMFFSPTLSPAQTSSTNFPPAPAPALSTLTSLTPLQHHISVIHASALFHLFPHSQQRTLAYLLGSLLSSLPGSLILGSHMGLPDTNDDHLIPVEWDGQGTTLFGHRPADWERLWVGENGVFKPEDVVFISKTVDVEREDMIQTGGDPFYKLLIWSVTRVK